MAAQEFEAPYSKYHVVLRILFPTYHTTSIRCELRILTCFWLSTLYKNFGRFLKSRALEGCSCSHFSTHQGGTTIFGETGCLNHLEYAFGI